MYLILRILTPCWELAGKLFSMKRKVLFVLAAFVMLSTMFVACSKDDDDDDGFTVNKQSITLAHDGTETVVASENATWSSDNEFVATVDNNGVITGKHVGEATITATANGKSQKVKVTVKAMYNTIPEPITDFSLSKSEVKAKETHTLYKEEDYKLNYTTNASKSELVMYSFDETSGKLKSSAWGAALTAVAPSELVGFLTERYQLLTYDDDYYYFANSDELETATMVVTFTMTNGNALIVYLPYEKKNTSKALHTELESTLRIYSTQL